MLKKTCISIFLFAFLLPGESHAYLKVDSLIRVLLRAPQDTHRVNTLNLLAQVFLQTGKYDSAFAYSDTAMKLATLLKFDRGIAASHNLLGILFENKGNYPEALHHQLDALKIRERIQDKKGLAVSYNNIGNVQMLIGNYSGALKNFKSSLAIKKLLNDRKGLMNTYNNIGLVYYYLKDYDQAMKYYEEAKRIAVEFKSKRGMTNALTNMGIIYEQKGEIDKAIALQHECLKLAEELGDDQSIASVHINLANVYINLRNFPKASQHLRIGWKLAQQIGSKDYLMECHHAQAQIDSANGNFSSAFANYKFFIQYQDSLVNEENTEKTVRQQLQFEFDKQRTTDSIQRQETMKQEVIRREQKIAQQKLYTWGGGIGFVLMLAAAGVSLGAYREKHKANATISRQKMLVEAKQKEILDSIHYAKRIQEGLLPTEKYLEKKLKELKG